MKHDYQALTLALIAAKQAAATCRYQCLVRAAEVTPLEQPSMSDLQITADGGSCNFDSVAFRGVGLREALVHEAAEAAGVEVSKVRRYGSTEYHITDIYAGMAALRTRMMEAARLAMQQAAPEGLEVWGDYVLD